MTAPVDESVSAAPKFHKDRSGYAAALRTWFERQVPGAERVEIGDLEIPVATGFSNETVFFTARWERDGAAHEQRFVGRIEPADGALFPVQNPATAVSVGLQYRIMEAIATNGAVAPMPPLVGFEPDAAVLGQPFFVMGFVDGVIPADTPRYSEAGFLVDDASPEERRRMVEGGLGAMAALHRLDWRAAGLDWLLPADTAAPTQAAQLALYRRFVTDELDGRTHPVLHGALDWLDANDPHDERVGLSWGDSRLGNIIWQDYGAAAVVDWEACAICPTEADVGWWLMFDRMSFDDLGIARLEGFPTREEMIAHYEQVSGRAVRDPHYWEVFAAMRFCAIFIRLADRMTRAGLVPPELNMAVHNQVTDAVARLLGIENPTPSFY